MESCKHDALDNHDCYKPDEAEEVLVISLSDAGAQPGAVMVQPLDAAVADATMNRSWWSVQVTSVAILNFGQSPVYDR